MKARQITFSLFVFLLSFSPSFATSDTLLTEHSKLLQSHSKNLTELKSGIDSLKMAIDKSTSKSKEHPLVFLEWVLVFSPFLLFLIIWLAIKKKLNGFNLNEALSEAELPKTIIRNPDYSVSNMLQLAANANTAQTIGTLLPPTIEITAPNMVYTKSSSRYIAFITSALSWLIVLCLSTFYMYQFLRNGIAPDLGGFSSVLLSMGIGVVPYAFNKMSNAVK